MPNPKRNDLWSKPGPLPLEIPEKDQIAVLEFLHRKGNASAVQIAAVIGRDRWTTDRYLNKMREAGTVTRDEGKKATWRAIHPPRLVAKAKSNG
jgi:predicted transcriptional regulator